MRNSRIKSKNCKRKETGEEDMNRRKKREKRSQHYRKEEKVIQKRNNKTSEIYLDKISLLPDGWKNQIEGGDEILLHPDGWRGKN